MFVVGRAFTGAGVAGSVAGYFKLIMDVYSPQKRPVFTAVFGAVEMLTAVIAPVLSSFSDIFMAILTIQLTSQGVTYPWNSPIIIGLFATGGALTILLIIQQRFRGDTGILPARLLRNRNVFPAVIFSLCVSSSLSLVEYYAPTYFQAVHGYGPARSGYMMFPSLIGTLIGVLIQGSGTSAFGYYSPFMLFSSIMTAISTGLMTTWNPTTGLAKLILYFALTGFGAGIGWLCPQNAVSTALSRSDAQLGMALILFAQNFGPALSVSVGQAIFTNRLSTNLVRLAPAGTNITYVEDLGLTEIAHVYHGTVLREITTAFGDAITQTWYLALGLMCCSFVGPALLPWVSVKKKQQ